jgi:hypothetical protein
MIGVIEVFSGGGLIIQNNTFGGNKDAQFAIFSVFFVFYIVAIV